METISYASNPVKKNRNTSIYFMTKNTYLKSVVKGESFCRYIPSCVGNIASVGSFVTSHGCLPNHSCIRTSFWTGVTTSSYRRH